MIHFHEGKVLDVTHCGVSRIGRSRATQKYEASMDLNEEGETVVRLKIRDNRKVIMEDAQPVRYGEAKTFKHNRPGHMIVLLHMPE